MPSVYLADPDGLFRESLARALRRCGADVVEFVSGSELSAAAVKDEPDLIVLATDRDEMAGWQVLARFKCRRTGRPYPFVLVVDRNLSLDRMTSSLQGFLTDWSRLCVRSLAGILAWLQGRGRSGRFEVEAFGERGTILLSRGEVLEARWRELRGREVVRFFAEELHEEGFRFAERVDGVEATASASVDPSGSSADESEIRAGEARTPDELWRAEAHVELARRLLARRQPGEALRFLQQAADGYERQLGDIHYLMALAHLGRGDVAAAVDELRVFRRSLPEEARPVAALAAKETPVVEEVAPTVLQAEGTVVLKAKRKAALEERAPAAAARQEPQASPVGPAATSPKGPPRPQAPPESAGAPSLEAPLESVGPQRIDFQGAHVQPTDVGRSPKTGSRRFVVRRPRWRSPSSVSIAALLGTLVILSTALAAVFGTSLPTAVVTLLSDLRTAGGKGQVREAGSRLAQAQARRSLREEEQRASREAARGQAETASSPETSAIPPVGPGQTGASQERPVGPGQLRVPEQQPPGIEPQATPRQSRADGPAELRTEPDAAAAPAKTAQGARAVESSDKLRGQPGLGNVVSWPRPRRVISPRSMRALIDVEFGQIEIIRAWTDSLPTERETDMWVWALVDASGQVQDARVLRSSGLRELDENAIQAVRKVRYAPARRAGVAVPAWVKQAVVFKLD